jgi:hypothetical protein
MDTLLLSVPREFGSVDARKKELLRCAGSSDGVVQSAAELAQILVVTVRQGVLGFCPNELDWIKFRRIPREAFHPTNGCVF